MSKKGKSKPGKLKLSKLAAGANNQVIKIHGARTHNLKNISLEIPRNKFVVLTGLSGSGKSSLAFDTIYAEAQRRYLENLASDFGKISAGRNSAEVDEIIGLSPAIAIDQKTTTRNSRSTVGTMTEIYDYLRLLYARVGISHCPNCDSALIKYTVSEIYNEIVKIKGKKSEKILILAPLGSDIAPRKLKEAKSEGFSKIKLGENILTVDEFLKSGKKDALGVFLVIEEMPASAMIEGLAEKTFLRDLINSALKYGAGQAAVNAGGKTYIFPTKFHCVKCNFEMENLSPKIFSFNHPSGACGVCTGLGTVLKVSGDLIIPNKKLTLAEGAIKPWRSAWTAWQSHYEALEAVAKKFNFSVNIPAAKLSREAMNIVLNGENAVKGGGNAEESLWRGAIPLIEEKYRETSSDFVKAEIEQYMVKRVCPECQGKRLNKTSLAVRIGNESINDLVQMPIEKLNLFLKDNSKNGGIFARDAKLAAIINPILKEVVLRTQAIADINLGYLMLARSSDTLSAGEAERLRLSTQIGAALSGILYVFDEPSIGLHPRDNEKIIQMLKNLRDLGNSVLVVEHEEAFIRAADWVADIGPGAGRNGGKIVAEGTIKDILKSKGFTGAYLSGKLKIERVRDKKTLINKKNCLSIYGAKEFNLKNVDIFIPLQKLVCFTGVSGSGKSTIVDDILGKFLSKHFYNAKAEVGKHDRISGIENIKKVIRIDQAPIGRTPRSNAATYTGLFNHIREIFSSTNDAKHLNYKVGHFSFNVKGGQCDSCNGDGVKKIEMYFLSDVYVSCEECNGARYNADTLKIKYKEKNIAEVLDMSVDEALKFFTDHEALANQLSILAKVGLGYLRLGQPATNLSGGEAQRIKLASELARPEKQGSTLYILDEPTVGLHAEDVRNLLNVLSQLVERGNTVLLIEHNLDIIKNADWIIDMGPEGGERGGEIVAQGTPEMIVKVKKSYTGQFLKNVLR